MTSSLDESPDWIANRSAVLLNMFTTFTSAPFSISSKTKLSGPVDYIVLNFIFCIKLSMSIACSCASLALTSQGGKNQSRIIFWIDHIYVCSFINQHSGNFIKSYEKNGHKGRKWILLWAHVMHRILPLFAAFIKAVVPRLFITPTSAPFWISSSAVFSYPKQQKEWSLFWIEIMRVFNKSPDSMANINAESFPPFVALMSAPFSISGSTKLSGPAKSIDRV